MSDRTCVAICRLEAWVREYGDRSQPPFLADLKTVIEAAKGEQRAELVTRFAIVQGGSENTHNYFAPDVWARAEEIVDAKPKIGGE